MPFKFLSDVGKNDNAVKHIFDSIRNLGLTALILGAGKWKFNNLGEGWSYYLNYFFAMVLYIAAFSLYVITIENTHYKIRTLKFPMWTKAILGGLHAAIFMQVLDFIGASKY